jgi:hypothetical protein
MPLMATTKHAGIFTFVVGMLWRDSQWRQTIILGEQPQQHGTGIRFEHMDRLNIY